MSEYGDTLIAQRISMISGVAQVLVFGAKKYAELAQEVLKSVKNA